MKFKIKNKAVAYLIILIFVFSVYGNAANFKIGTDSSNRSWFGPITESVIKTSTGKVFTATSRNLQLAVWEGNTTGAIVELPQNDNITITERIDIPGNITIMGNNCNIYSASTSYYLYAENENSITLKDINCLGMCEIKIIADSNNEIEDFVLENIDMLLTNSESTYSIYFYVNQGIINNITIRDININFPAGAGLVLRGNPGGSNPRNYNNVWIENVFVYDTGDSGFDFGIAVSESAFLDNCTVIGCTVMNTYEAGFSGENGFWNRNIRFIDCVAQNCDNGNGAPVYGAGFIGAGDIEYINCKSYNSTTGFLISLEQDSINTRITNCFSHGDVNGIKVTNGNSGGKLFINGMITQNVTRAADFIYDDTTVMNPYIYSDNFYNVSGRYVTEIENNYYAVYPSDENLSLYLKFDEGTGTKCFDSSKFRNDGVFVNSVAWSSGKYGTGLEFNNDNEYVNCSNNGSLDITNEITLECWVYKTYNTGANDEGIITKYAFNSYALASGPTSFSCYISGGGHSASAQLHKDSGSRWYHIVGTFDGTIIKLYIDGRLVDTTAYVGSITSATNQGLIIGKNGDGGGQGYTGSIDEVRIYNRSLTPDEIQTHYLRGQSAHGFIMSNKFQIFDNDFNSLFKVTKTGGLILPTTAPSIPVPGSCYINVTTGLIGRYTSGGSYYWA